MVEITLEEGSLKGWIKIGSVLLGVYGFVANYSGFKQGVHDMITDARNFGDEFLNRFLRSRDLRGATVYRTERRTKTPGRIKRLIERREWLVAHRSQLNDNEIFAEEFEIERKLQELLLDVDPVERSTIRKIIGEPSAPLLPLRDRHIALPPFRQEQYDFAEDSAPDSAIDPDAYYHKFTLQEGANSPKRSVQQIR